MKTKSSFPSMLVALGLAAATPFVQAAEAPAAAVPQGIVRLSASASVEVTKDVLNIAFGTTREGTDAAQVQSQLKQALDAALAEAKKAARPGQVDVQTGNFALAPRYTNKGVVNGWQGSTELIVSGRDMQAIGQLSGRITTLTINRVGYGLSRELREKSDADLSAQAIAGFRAKAADYAREFGYAGYAIREVDVSSGGDQPMPAPMMRMRAAAVSSIAEEPLSVEPGKSTTSVVVSGTVQLNR